MTLQWTYAPGQGSLAPFWTAAEGDVTAEVWESQPRGRWVTTVRRAGLIQGTHVMTDTADEGKAAAEALAG